MHLTPREVERFFNTWFPLLHYVNQKRKLVPSFPATWSRDSSVKPEVAMPLRDALWADDSLRTAFIAENPARLSADDLALVESWQYRVTGNFMIFRHLSKYSVFLSDDSPAHAYGVLGLMDSLEVMTGPYMPMYVQAALLPFEGRIIYDGLLATYSILFGNGIRGDLNEEYSLIQEREGIITTLLPAKITDPEVTRKEIRARNKKVLTAFQKDLGRAGLTPKMMEEHTANIAAFAEKILLAKNPPVGVLYLTLMDIQVYFETKSLKPNAVSMKRFLQFLRDTGRIDYDEAEKWLKFLKKQRE